MASCFGTIAAFGMMVIFWSFGLRTLPAGSFAVLGAMWVAASSLQHSCLTAYFIQMVSI
jgi:hypothetical protein